MSIEEREISIAKFRRAIRKLPKDDPADYARKVDRRQKEHWLSWLFFYHTEGAYGRRTDVWRDAKFAYNHVVCPEMLVYLARAIPLRDELVEGAEDAYLNGGETMMAKSGAIRKVVPWSEIYQALFAEEEAGFFEKLKNGLKFAGKK